MLSHVMNLEIFDASEVWVMLEDESLGEAFHQSENNDLNNQEVHESQWGEFNNELYMALDFKQ